MSCQADQIRKENWCKKRLVSPHQAQAVTRSSGCLLPDPGLIVPHYQAAALSLVTWPPLAVLSRGEQIMCKLKPLIKNCCNLHDRYLKWQKMHAESARISGRWRSSVVWRQPPITMYSFISPDGHCGIVTRGQAEHCHPRHCAAPSHPAQTRHVGDVSTKTIKRAFFKWPLLCKNQNKYLKHLVWIAG